MREHQAKREHLTIYLVRDAKLKDEQIVKTDRAKPPVDLRISAGKARLYAKKSSRPKLPDWAPFLVRNQDVPPDLFEGSRSEGAVLLVLTCLISSGHFNLGERPRLLQLNNTAA
ncbi:ISBma1, transposase [Burkholderia pseudomallei]|nr:ISBma1, transposase [Burkholderia pseudomallei]